ncbi:MAG: hypothetical protein AAGA87_08650 [Pseudomonadota bacterium]
MKTSTRSGWRGLLSPKRLFSLAAVFAAAGFVAVYVDVIERVDRALALRQGPPQLVAIQEFSPGLHEGPVREVFVTAEAAFDRAVMVRLPDDREAVRALVIPLYAASDATEMPKNAVMGLLYHPITPDLPEPTDPRAFADAVYGEGEYGTRIDLNGILADRRSFEPLAKAAFSEMGVMVTDSVLGIRPFAGRRTEMLEARPEPRLIQALFIISLSLFAASAAIAFQAPVSRPLEDVADEEDTGAPAQHPSFAPIPTQQEIAIEERALQEPDMPHWSKKALGQIMAWIRTRRTRREDEAL